MTGRLAGKAAIVTGAGSVGPGWGNGKATAALFAPLVVCVHYAGEGSYLAVADALVLHPSQYGCAAESIDTERRPFASEWLPDLL